MKTFSPTTASTTASTTAPTTAPSTTASSVKHAQGAPGLAVSACFETYSVNIPEHQLQAHWFSGGFGRSFQTTDGRRVEVLQPGVWNHQAGPDFADAAVAFSGGPPVRGSIELDPDVRDWERHGHAGNPEYEGVVLHVFVSRGKAECFTRTRSHRLVPQICLEDFGRNPETNPEGIQSIQSRSSRPCWASDFSQEPLLEAVPGRCVLTLSRLPASRVDQLLSEAAARRMAAKAAVLGQVAEWHGLEEAVYQGVAGALGYRGNELAFTLLAQRVPLRVLAEAGPSAEALLFGVSGFLSRPERGMAPAAREYLRGLWDRWWPLRAEWERLLIPPQLWRRGGQRPANHPHRRLGALAVLAGRWNEFRRLRRGAGDASVFFRSLRHPYWSRHYCLAGRASKSELALIGVDRSEEIRTNVLAPLGPGLGTATGRGRAPLNKRILVVWQRLFGRRPLEKRLLRDARFQQGLLQLYQEFCARDCTGCQSCRFPEQLAHWAAESN